MTVVNISNAELSDTRYLIKISSKVADNTCFWTEGVPAMYR